MMHSVHIFSSGTKAYQRTWSVHIKQLATWPHWLSFHLSHCERVAIRQALFSSMDGCVTVVITVYMGRICLCKYVCLMHGALSGMSPIRAASLSSCQSHLNRTTGPEPDSNSSTDERVWVLHIYFLPSLTFFFSCTGGIEGLRSSGKALGHQRLRRHNYEIKCPNNKKLHCKYEKSSNFENEHYTTDSNVL